MLEENWGTLTILVNVRELKTIEEVNETIEKSKETMKISTLKETIWILGITQGKIKDQTSREVTTTLNIHKDIMASYLNHISKYPTLFRNPRDHFDSVLQIKKIKMFQKVSQSSVHLSPYCKIDALK